MIGERIFKISDISDGSSGNFTFFTLSQKTYLSVSIFLVRDSLQDNGLLLVKELTSYDGFARKKYKSFFQGQHT